MNTVNVFIEKCNEDATIPSYANDGDAGMDICSVVDIVVKPGETVIIPTGLKFAIPRGYEIQVRPRSSISLNTMLRIVNSPGTIDSGYRDELGIIISNASNPEYRDYCYTLKTARNKMGSYKISKGD